MSENKVNVEIIYKQDNLTRIRYKVPGGWIYETHVYESRHFTSVFVPDTIQSQPDPDKDWLMQDHDNEKPVRTQDPMMDEIIEDQETGDSDNPTNRFDYCIEETDEEKQKLAEIYGVEASSIHSIHNRKLLNKKHSGYFYKE